MIVNPVLGADLADEIPCGFRDAKQGQQGSDSGIWQRARTLLYAHILTIS
jgi:hypothetical protein